jgi:serine/threonine protein phosphatase PrpC
VNKAPFILEGTETADLCTGVVAGGEFVAYTRRSPDKTTDNEDTVAIVPCGPQAAVFVVADGAGGLPAGRRASQTAVKTMIASLDAVQDGTNLLRNAILNGIEAANAAVQQLGNGSATTLTVVGVEGRVVRAYQVGDSEALVVGQRGRIRLQTTAHSPTGFAVHAGFLDQREALHHEERHLVSNFLGTPDMRIDIGAEVTLQSRDTVLLASDGLMDNVHLEEIVERVRKGSLAAAASNVTALAQHRMRDESSSQPSKPDDLSLILFRKPRPRVPKSSTKPLV